MKQPLQTSFNPPPGILYVLALGVGAFRNREVRAVPHAARDARDVAACLSAEGRQSPNRFDRVETRVLVDGEATRKRILEALGWLRMSAKEVGDVAILYVSGHGATDDALDLHLLPTDLDPAQFKGTTVPLAAVQRAVEGEKRRGQTLAFMDLYHGSPLAPLAGKRGGKAGGRPPITPRGNLMRGQRRLWRDARVLPATVRTLVAATGREADGADSVRGKNGPFATALIEALRAQETAEHLMTYVVRRVPEITGGRQHPWVVETGRINDTDFILFPRPVTPDQS